MGLIESAEVKDIFHPEEVVLKKRLTPKYVNMLGQNVLGGSPLEAYVFSDTDAFLRGQHSLNDLSFRDPNDFVAGQLTKNYHNWQLIFGDISDSSLKSDVDS